MSSRSTPKADDVAAKFPSEGVRSALTLFLCIHLFCIFVALCSNSTPSPLQSRLLGFLAPYTRLLNFDLNYTPYYLTFGPPSDGSESIEILPAGSDPAVPQNWHVLPDVGYSGGDRRQRYERLAEVMAFYAQQDEEEIPGLIAQSIAAHFQTAEQLEPSQIRCRTHIPQMREWIGGGTPAQRDWLDPSHFRVDYAANVVVSDDGSVSIVKIEEASQVARPDRQEN
jgi:hypothetical protein